MKNDNVIELAEHVSVPSKRKLAVIGALVITSVVSIAAFALAIRAAGVDEESNFTEN